MDVERIIDDIEQLQEMFEAPDIRPLSASDMDAANRRHDEALAHSPWFRLWQRYGVCCRRIPDAAARRYKQLKPESREPDSQKVQSSASVAELWLEPLKNAG
jgi:hypothetical protein